MSRTDQRTLQLMQGTNTGARSLAAYLKKAKVKVEYNQASFNDLRTALTALLQFMLTAETSGHPGDAAHERRIQLNIALLTELVVKLNARYINPGQQKVMVTYTHAEALLFLVFIGRFEMQDLFQHALPYQNVLLYTTRQLNPQYI